MSHITEKDATFEAFKEDIKKEDIDSSLFVELIEENYEGLFKKNPERVDLPGHLGNVHHTIIIDHKEAI